MYNIVKSVRKAATFYLFFFFLPQPNVEKNVNVGVRNNNLL